jgi:hypothetical protein
MSDEMELDLALVILADGHTRDDELAGFVVHQSRDTWSRWSDAEYIGAWKTVREYLHLPVQTRFEREAALSAVPVEQEK